jgi:histidinol phosphatase-like enzyme (inositol monophosphatase family)
MQRRLELGAAPCQIAGMSTQEDLAGFLDKLADAAGGAVMPHFRQGVAVDNKGEHGFDPVTVADRASEQAMLALIAAHYPEHGVLGEEFGALRSGAHHTWVLDPIDGTRAFISGLPTWGTLIGLTEAGRPVLGMMAQPFTGERYAGDCRRAWYSGPGGPRALKTRRCAGLDQATLFTTAPNLFKGEERAAFDRVEAKVRLSRYGVDCYAYAMVAAGHADIVIESGLQPYDIVALIPIVEGAGGQVTNWTGGSTASGGQVLATGDARVHEAALKLLAR